MKDLIQDAYATLTKGEGLELYKKLLIDHTKRLGEWLIEKKLAAESTKSHMDKQLNEVKNITDKRVWPQCFYSNKSLTEDVEQYQISKKLRPSGKNSTLELKFFLDPEKGYQYTFHDIFGRMKLAPCTTLVFARGFLFLPN